MSEMFQIRYWIDIAIIILALFGAGLVMYVIVFLHHGLQKNVVRPHIKRPFEPKDDVPDGQPDS